MAFRDDLISALTLPLGRDRAARTVAEAEVYLKDQVQRGAIAAIPAVKKKALAEAKPYLIGGGIAFGATFLIAVGAFIRTFRR